MDFTRIARPGILDADLWRESAEYRLLKQQIIDDVYAGVYGGDEDERYQWIFYCITDWARDEWHEKQKQKQK